MLVGSLLDKGRRHLDIQLAFGAYLGEVLVRRTRGRWVTGFSDDELDHGLTVLERAITAT